MTTRNIGRTFGALALLQALLAIPVYTEFGMMRSVMGANFLADAAAHASEIRLALLLVLVLGWLTFGMGLVAWPVFKRGSERLALLYLGLGIAGIAAQTIEPHVVRNMLTLSIANSNHSMTPETLSALGVAAKSAWSSTHFTSLLYGHITAFTLFIILYRMHLVPRLLSGAGIATTLLSMTAALLSLLGHPFSYAMVAPTGLVQLTLTIWLIGRGFSDGKLAPQIVCDSALLH